MRLKTLHTSPNPSWSRSWSPDPCAVCRRTVCLCVTMASSILMLGQAEGQGDDHDQGRVSVLVTVLMTIAMLS